MKNRVLGNLNARIVIVAVALALYSWIVAGSILGGWAHYELVALTAGVVILCPALLYALWGAKRGLPGVAQRYSQRANLWILAFLSVAMGLSWRVSQGVMISDESAYKFQASIFASGKLRALPPPGAGERATDVPRPFRFAHHIAVATGWFTKYPPGWPLVLAIPERAHIAWLVNPVLGALLLLIIGNVAREIFGPSHVLPATVMAVLSPYMLANCIGRMPHALEGVLIGASCLVCIQGIARRRFAYFVWMFALLFCAFQVRPYTTFVAASVFSVTALVSLRGERKLMARVAALAAVYVIAVTCSLVTYNVLLTGHVWPLAYALSRGGDVVIETGATLPQVFRNIETTWRFAAQSTVLYSFPFVFPLACYGFWKRRDSYAGWMFVALFGGMVLAHLVQVEASSSIVGERYWFEAYFGVLVLGTDGLLRLISRGLPSKALTVVITWGLVAVQVVVIAAATVKLDLASDTRRKVQITAEAYRHCHCVVFLMDSPPFYGEHLNLNVSGWVSSDVFYAIDPGPSERQAWANRLGRRDWVVVTWDSRHRIARTDAVHLYSAVPPSTSLVRTVSASKMVLVHR